MGFFDTLKVADGAKKVAEVKKVSPREKFVEQMNGQLDYVREAIEEGSIAKLRTRYSEDHAVELARLKREADRTGAPAGKPKTKERLILWFEETSGGFVTGFRYGTMSFNPMGGKNPKEVFEAGKTLQDLAKFYEGAIAAAEAGELDKRLEAAEKARKPTGRAAAAVPVASAAKTGTK